VDHVSEQARASAQRGLLVALRMLHVALRMLLCAMLLFGPAQAWAAGAAEEAAASLLERRVKAALLFRFVNYVDWPESAFPSSSAPFVIGVAGADQLHAELAEVAIGRSVLNRPLVVRRVQGPDAAKDVQILYVGHDMRSQFPGVMRAAPPGALVVTDWDSALRSGSVINFVLVGGQVRFEISLEAAQRRNIRLSSRLLSVAHQVEQ
jgi:hypothetical protein